MLRILLLPVLGLLAIAGASTVVVLGVLVFYVLEFMLAALSRR